ncbi:GNAT family N-acetyltransferase [Phytomonospora endophytica]|uniref:RimJ/RimL family protein N-acetyltransferase n=1 Tax=Phytomonospora endophytica TaxID=714109 RepID=A0A841FU98_9ACTN|nr:GNAT family N-acetyltransferase [Phytomonospora endophytica]MBB6036917.1 RimJ/RimL family protein N-acetyltransferase [Phytomonospora endophytica]
MTTILLRPVELTDLDAFFAYESEPEGRRRAVFPERDRETFMTHWKTRILAGPDVRARTVLVDGEVAGNILSWSQDGRQMVGYWYGQRFWGRGIGSLALAEYVKEMPDRPLYADTVEGNIGSIRVLERCGFARIDSDEEGIALFVLGAE